VFGLPAAPRAPPLFAAARGAGRDGEVLRQAANHLAILRLPLPPFPQITNPPVEVPQVRTARLAFDSGGRRVVIARILDRQENLARPFPYVPGSPLAE
jgi:hypothetical protein